MFRKYPETVLVPWGGQTRRYLGPGGTGRTMQRRGEV